MKIGVNWGGSRSVDVIKNLISNGDVDFVEIMIDNFLSIDPEEILEFMGDIPVAFHIMNSHFIQSPMDRLVNFAKKIKLFSKKISPIYISDHIGTFYSKDKLPLPQMVEVDYQDFEFIFKRIELWKDLIEEEIIFENFPSSRKQKLRQSDFFRKLISEEKSGILFDISNCIVSSINGAEDIDSWMPISERANNFHIGGYSFSSHFEKMCIDTHDRGPSFEALCMLRSIFSYNNNFTLVVERDENQDYRLWKKDINLINSFIKK